MSEVNTTESTKQVVIATRKHAAFLLGAAVARLVKQEAAVAETKLVITKYEELVATLPEVAEAVVSVIEAGTEVDFEYGRGPTRKLLTGVVKARKDKDGKPEFYRIVVGQDFEEKSYVVQPGSVKSVSTKGEPLGDQAAADEVAALGEEGQV